MSERDASGVRLRRATVTAPDAVLRVLEAEARRRSVSLTVVLREAVEDRARTVLARRRPSFGLARSTDGLSAAEVSGEPVAADPRG
jgi:hypothetical protein